MFFYLCQEAAFLKSIAKFVGENDVEKFAIFNCCFLRKGCTWDCDFKWLLYYLSIANLSQIWPSPSSSKYIYFSFLSLSIYYLLRISSIILTLNKFDHWIALLKTFSTIYYTFF